MTKLIRVDAEAEEEIAHAIEHYEEEREGLGAEFWDELSAALQTLEAPVPNADPSSVCHVTWVSVASCWCGSHMRSCSSRVKRSCA